MPTRSRISRRDVLKSALVFAGTTCAGALGARSAHAQTKASKATFKYQDKPNGDQKCSDCAQFEPPGSCKVVEGAISPNGYCIAWAKKA
jgi:hypothetical protein